MKTSFKIQLTCVTTLITKTLALEKSLYHQYVVRLTSYIFFVEKFVVYSIFMFLAAFNKHPISPGRLNITAQQRRRVRKLVKGLWVAQRCLFRTCTEQAGQRGANTI